MRAIAKRKTNPNREEEALQAIDLKLKQRSNHIWIRSVQETDLNPATKVVPQIIRQAGCLYQSLEILFQTTLPAIDLIKSKSRRKSHWLLETHHLKIKNLRVLSSLTAQRISLHRWPSTITKMMKTRKKKVLKRKLCQRLFKRKSQRCKLKLKSH